MNLKAFILILLLIPILTLAQTSQDTTDIKTFELGEVLIYSNSPKDKITKKNMTDYRKPDVAQALNIMPSVVMNYTGKRNESGIYMRGFDSRSVPVYVDGIPVYVPYDGYADLSRFTTADVSKIDVSKGFSSILYGPNAMGGTINLISSKPTNNFELRTKAGLFSGEGFDNYASVGTRQNKWMAQASFSQFDQSFVPLSQQFEISDNETDFKRDNSYRKDRKFTAKIGFMPNKTDEYVLSYSNQKGNKGSPTYIGADKSIRVRYWQWPHWDKESLYFISKTKLSAKAQLKARLYLDQFDNTLSAYDNDTYSTQNKRYTFTSTYDDQTFGGSLETAFDLNQNDLKMAFHIKRDEHKALDGDALPVEAIDHIYTIGVEDQYNVNNQLTLIGGASASLRQGIKADDANSTNEDGTYKAFENNNNQTFNIQLAGQYRLNQEVSLNSSIAYKTRFATMKDRFSYKLNKAIPNPDLSPEQALNIDLGVTLKLAKGIYLKPELFSSHLRNTIQQVNNVEVDKSQMQNTGRSHFYGADLALIYQPEFPIEWRLNYSFIKRKNLSNPDLLFTDVPEHHVFSALAYKGVKAFDFNINTEYASNRYSSSYGNVSKAFMVFNSRAAYRFNNGVGLELGVHNIFDRNYTIAEGYPEAGRTFYAGLLYQFTKK